MNDLTLALSIRQPWAELILRRLKTKEYRSRRTHVRGRVFLYASRKPADWPRAWRAVGKEPGGLPVGKIIGTVEIIGCRWSGREGAFVWLLSKPRRFLKPLSPTNRAQPVFWRPRF